MIGAVAMAVILTVLPAVAARAVVSCDNTPTVGDEPHQPYVDPNVAATIARNPAYRYGQNPFVYTLFVPDGLPDGPVPLLVALPGLGLSAADYEGRGLQDLAAREGFIVAFV